MTFKFCDQELVAALRGGDKRVASTFHRRVRPQIDRTLRRLFRCRDVDHDDLQQLASIELLKTIDRFRGECSLDAWVGALTSRIAFKHLRRRQLERRIFGELDPRSLATPSLGHSDPSTRSLLRHVARHLEAIDANRARALFLHDVLGYELAELAPMLGVSVSAAQSRVVRGRRDLRDRFLGDPELADLVKCRRREAPVTTPPCPPSAPSLGARPRRRLLQPNMAVR